MSDKRICQINFLKANFPHICQMMNYAIFKNHCLRFWLLLFSWDICLAAVYGTSIRGRVLQEMVDK